MVEKLVYLCRGIYLAVTRNELTDTCNNLDGFQEYCLVKKANLKNRGLCNSIYVTFLNAHNQTKTG